MGLSRLATWAWRGALIASAATGSVLHAQPQTTFELRWGGLVHDTITFDGVENWTGEDGGRIRHRTAAGTWSFQNVPSEVKDTVRRVFFLDDRLSGWAVAQNGWVLRTTDGGTNWNVIHRVPAVAPGAGAWEDMWDIHFLDTQMGWLVGLRGMWMTTDGGTNWTSVTLLNDDGTPLVDDELELYTVDVVPGTDFQPIPGWNAQPGGVLLGLALAEPGYILRSIDGVVWQVVLDVRDLCDVLPPCAQSICEFVEPGEETLHFEPWDVAISRNANQSLALVVGGLDNACGTVFGSLDNGVTWQQEPHECRCAGQPGCINCNTNPLYDNNPNTQTDTWRQRRYFTLYGVGIFDGDNSAVACGYSGQQVVRDPVNRIWRDRSNFTNDPFHAVNSCTLPLFGAEADGGTATNGIAYITGMGGYVRRSTNGGQTWITEQLGEPWRVRDVWFFDENVGWMIGQFFRMARSTDGGRTWTPAAPEPQLGTGFMQAISFANPFVGVAVGDVDNRPGPHEGKPKILVTTDGGATPWLEPTLYVLQGNTVSTSLNDVTAVGETHFWAAGNNGLILRSIDSGDTWRQFIPPGSLYADIDDIEFLGVAFQNPNAGIFVGQRPTSQGGTRPVAFAYRKNGIVPTWTDITSTDTTISLLSDVAFVGNKAYVIGARATPDQGVVLTSTTTSAAFSKLVQISHPPFPACDVDESLTQVPVLSQIEAAPDGDLWIGGECGRVWQLTPPNLWVEHKSQTDAHIQGMSVPLADTGMLACQRSSRTGWSIVRFRP